MTIREMQAAFGKLDNRTMTLSEGFNIIEGANESGKSTWCAFIRAMLYGVNTSERDTKTSLAVKNRYRPWTGVPMSGVMRINTAKYGEIIIERRSASTAAPMRDLLVYSVSGDKIMLSESNLGEEILGIGRDCFERSVFIETPLFPSGSTAELERRIMGLVSSGDENSSFTEAVSALREWQRRLLYRNSGKIPELENKLYELRRESETNINGLSELDQIRTRITELDREKNILYSDLAQQQEHYLESHRQRIRLAEERLKAAEIAFAEASKRLPGGSPRPTADELRDLERRFYAEAENKRVSEARDALLRERQRRIDQIKTRLSGFKPFAGCPAEKAKEMVLNDIDSLENLSLKRIARDIFIRLAPLLIIPAALSVLILLLSPDKFQGIPSWCASVSLFAGSVAVLLLTSRSRAKKGMLALTERILGKYEARDIPEINQMLESYFSIMDEYNQVAKDVDTHSQPVTHGISDDVIARIIDIFPQFANTAEMENELLQEVRSAIAAIEDYERALVERNTAAEILNALQAGRANGPDNSWQYISHLPDETRVRLEKIENELSGLRRHAALLEGRLSQARQPSELESEIKLLQARLDKLNKHYAALSLAIETLSDAYKQLRERFSPRLNTETAKIFSALTSDKYNRVIITREFEAMAQDSGNSGLRRALELSRGTMDQLYLALRLAICRMVLPASDNLPLILDDALISFDDGRMAAALEWLYNESKERQILLFTCQKREGDYLKGREGVSILTI